MSLPDHNFAITTSSELLQQTLETREDWPVSTSITTNSLPNRIQEQTPSTPDPYSSQAVLNFQQIYEESVITSIEPHTIVYPACDQQYFHPIAPQPEIDLLDTWIPNFLGEPSIYQTGTINQGPHVIEQLWPWDNGTCETSCEFKSYDTEQYTQPELAEPQDIMMQKLDGCPESSDAALLRTISYDSAETVRHHTKRTETINMSRGYRVDEVLRTLRQMDYQIRSMNRKHMADIACSSTV
ncbi:hypothetical protein V8C35DRAFT_302720 [Trichoderma chlorosporum]